MTVYGRGRNAGGGLTKYCGTQGRARWVLGERYSQMTLQTRPQER